MVGFSFALLTKPKGRPSRLHSIGDRGLLSGDRKRFFVDLSKFGRSEILLGHAHLIYDPPARMQSASVTVSAYPQTSQIDQPEEIFALWNDGANNPIAVWESAKDLLGAADLDAAFSGTMRVFDTSELNARAATMRRNDPGDVLPEWT